MLDVFSMSASLGLDDSNFTSGLNNAESKTNDLSVTTVAVGKIMADAFESVIEKVGEFATSCVEAGSTEESALAKVQTIMDNTQVSTSDMNEAIKKLSSEMGVSVEDISDAVYNTISATGDTANAVSLTEQASKLATAGFTDTSSALSTLTTVMNAYGMTADDATHISDSLMEVQNKGVTTVGDLSANMGKAIASASAYGVNLENLESAYISITKAGINTAEGTTYISSMLKELGDSGSDVSAVLQEQTGKSFDELMDSGYSLGDVLGILYDSVDGDSTALMNLWSSAEAGKASSAIVGQGIEAFDENLQDLQETTGTTEEAYATMADTFEHKQDLFNTEIENMKSELFEKLEPGLEKLFDFVETDIFPMLDWAIEHSDILLPILAGLATSLGVLTIAFTGFTIVDKVKESFIAFNLALEANPIILIVTLIAGLVVALVGLYNTSETFRAFVDTACQDIIGFVTTVVNSIIDFFTVTIPEKVNQLLEIVEGIPQWFENLPGRLAYSLGYALGELVKWVNWMATDEVPRVGSEVIDAIVAFFTGLPGRLSDAFWDAIDAFGTFIYNFGTSIQTKVPSLIDDLVEFFEGLPEDFKTIGKNIVDGMLNGITSAWKNLKKSVENLVGNFVQGFKDSLGIHSPSKVFAQIGDYMAQGLGEGWDNAFESVNDDIISGLDFSGETANVELNSNASSVSNADIYSLLSQYLPTITENMNNQQITLNGREVGRMVRAYS